MELLQGARASVTSRRWRLRPPGNAGVGPEREHPVHQLQPLRSMGDQQHGLLGGGAEHVVDQLVRGAGIQVGGRLVEHQHRCVGEQRAGEHDPLPLSAGERLALLADDRVKAVRKLACPLPDPSAAQRLLDVAVARSGRARRTLSRMLALNRCESWPATEITRRMSACRYSRRSLPASVTRPSWGSRKRRSRFATVVLPAPLGPTSATLSPGSSASATPSSAGRR